MSIFGRVPLQYVAADVVDAAAATAAVGLDMSMVSIGLDESTCPDTPSGADDDGGVRVREGSMISIGLTDEASVSPVPEVEEDGVPGADEAVATSN